MINDFDINNEIYSKLSGITSNVTHAFYDDNQVGDALYFTTEISKAYDTLDKVSYAFDYDIKVKIISDYTDNLYSITKQVKENLINGQYLYIRHVTFERDNFLYDGFVKKYTLTLSFSGYVSNN